MAKKTRWVDRPQHIREDRKAYERKTDKKCPDHAERMRKLWQTEEYRRKVSEGVKRSWQQPERRNPRNTGARVPKHMRREEAEAAYARIDAMVRGAHAKAIDPDTGALDGERFLEELLKAKGVRAAKADELLNGPQAALAEALMSTKPK
jgi:hypothetical protein